MIDISNFIERHAEKNGYENFSFDAEKVTGNIKAYGDVDVEAVRKEEVGGEDDEILETVTSFTINTSDMELIDENENNIEFITKAFFKL